MAMSKRFKTYLRRVARETANLLNEFEQPPTFELWQNPVVASASGLRSLRGGSRETETDQLFDASGASGLVDDGRRLITGGITSQRRLWLLYCYDSLTDFDGHSNYTSVNAVVSSILTEPKTMDLWFGFDWLPSESISRLNFEPEEAKIVADVLSRNHWRALHRLQVRV